MVPFWLKILAFALLWPIAGLAALFSWGHEEASFRAVIYGWLAVGFMLLVLISSHHARQPDRWDDLRGNRGGRVKPPDTEAGAPS